MCHCIDLFIDSSNLGGVGDVHPDNQFVGGGGGMRDPRVNLVLGLDRNGGDEDEVDNLTVGRSDR